MSCQASFFYYSFADRFIVKVKIKNQSRKALKIQPRLLFLIQKQFSDFKITNRIAKKKDLLKPVMPSLST